MWHYSYTLHWDIQTKPIGVFPQFWNVCLNKRNKLSWVRLVLVCFFFFTYLLGQLRKVMYILKKQTAITVCMKFYFQLWNMHFLPVLKAEDKALIRSYTISSQEATVKWGARYLCNHRDYCVFNAMQMLTFFYKLNYVTVINRIQGNKSSVKYIEIPHRLQSTVLSFEAFSTL